MTTTESPQELGRLLMPEEVAELLGVSIKTLYTWTSAGSIPYVKPSRSVLRFRRADIADWLEERTRRPEAK